MSIAEIYSVLYGMEQAYEQVLLTFGSVVGDVQDIRERLEALERRVDRELSDAVTGRDLWETVAAAHKAEVARLRAEIEALRPGG